MAGAGYKLFNTGDVLTAAQVNTYLMEQTIMVFASAAARDTALSGVLAQGMQCFLKDTNTMQYYSGSAWVTLSTGGDITSVVAGTGLSGGGTSGDVTLNLSTPVSATNGGTAQSTYATGDIVYASASNTLAKRTIGTTGQVLTVSGGVPTWSTPSSSTPTYVGCSVSNSVSQSISNATETTMTFDTEQFDTDNFHSTVSNTSRMTIPSGKGGKYLLSGMFNPGTNGANMEFYVYVNGSYYITGFPQTQATGNSRGTTMAILNVVLNLNAADYVEVRVYQDFGSAVNVRNQYGRYQISYIGA